MSNILVDTNLLIYSVDQRSEHFEKSRNFLSNPINNLYTTSKNISEFLSVITRKPPKPISIKDSLTFVDQFAAFIKIIFPSPDSFSKFRKLLLKYNKTGIRVHDIEIISIGLSNGIKKFSTMNIKDFAEIDEIELIDMKKNEYSK